MKEAGQRQVQSSRAPSWLIRGDVTAAGAVAMGCVASVGPHAFSTLAGFVDHAVKSQKRRAH